MVGEHVCQAHAIAFWTSLFDYVRFQRAAAHSSLADVPGLSGNAEHTWLSQE